MANEKAKADEMTGEDVRLDDTLGIDKSEQPGLGGDSSVLEDYGVDIEPDDLPERPDVPPEAVLPGTDPDVPADLTAEHGRRDPNLPPVGHETKKGH